MGGGLIQLVAIGTQDVFLTGNPQMTFFKIIYRRYTNFSKECVEVELSGNNNNYNCTLPRIGDLVQEIYLKTDVGDLSSIKQLKNNFSMKK